MPASKINNAPEQGFGVYIHWPFCRKKCPYCDFNSHVRETVDQKEWVDAYLKELAWFSSQTKEKEVTSIFFGGGTPSLMHPETVGALIEGVSKHFIIRSDAEITLEANPTSVEAQSFYGYRSAGVNRLSMGVQSLRNDALRFLGREHSAEEAIEAIEVARKAFDNISFDLIYALPGQTVEEWTTDLKQALTLSGNHISLYQLTIEPNTGFAGAVNRGEFQVPKDEIAEEMFLVTQQVCSDQGMPAYEISNHAVPGFECRHNLTYWRYGTYLGIGPGAHGRLTVNGKRQAFNRVKRPEAWLKQVQDQSHGTEHTEPVGDQQDIAEELLLMGLRLKEGVWFENFNASVGQEFAEVISETRLNNLISAGFVETNEQRIKATEKGRFLLNSVLAELLS